MHVGNFFFLQPLVSTPRVTCLERVSDWRDTAAIPATRHLGGRVRAAAAGCSLILALHSAPSAALLQRAATLPAAAPPPLLIRLPVLPTAMSGGASSRGVVDLTDDAVAAAEEGNILILLKEALKKKRRERKDAERIAQTLREEEEDLLVSVQELEEQEESARRERNRPDWAKSPFEWDCKVMELLQKTFKLPEFRALQREVFCSSPVCSRAFAPAENPLSLRRGFAFFKNQRNS